MQRLISVATGDLHWQIAPEYRELLLGPAGLRLESWLQSGQARIVKDGPQRTVYHVVLSELDCYVKRNRLPDMRAYLRQLVRPAKARIEFQHALLIAGRGIDTITPLAVGETRSANGDSYLVTRGLRDTLPLGDFLEQRLPALDAAGQTRVRVELARAFARLLARMHEAGIRHDDLHPGNFLVRLEAGRQPTLFLIDLHAVALGPKLDWPAARDNLVLINRWFALRASRSERRRFWQAYVLARGWLTADARRREPATLESRTRARELEKRTGQSNLLFWRGFDRRCLGNNRRYEKLRARGVAGNAVRGLDRALVARFLHDPDEPFGRTDIKMLKDSPSSTVIEMQATIDGQPRRLIYKRFRVTHWSEPWRGLVRQQPVLRSWLFGHALRERGLPTARPLLVLQRRQGGLEREGYLLAEKIEDAVELHEFVARLAELPEQARRPALRTLTERLARLIRKLHENRLSHRDLKAANLLVSGPPDDPRLCFIDLVGIRQHGKLSRQRRVANLARLNASFLRAGNVSNADRLRFLAVYRQWGLRGQAGWKDWWQAIAQATQAKVARNQKTGRPLA